MGVLSDNAIIGASNASGYDIDYSCRFYDGDSPKLSKTPSSASNRKTWTISCWVKITARGGIIPNGCFLDAGSNPNYIEVGIGADGKIRLYDPSAAGGANSIYIASTRLLRDPSSWYHIVIQLDTTQATNTDRVKIYVNNERETAFTQTDWPDQNYDSFINNNIEHTINVAGSSYSDCYLAEYHFIDGTALTPSSFGELDEDTNQWKAIKYAGTYGTNGFFLEFKSSGALGTDTSGEGNTYASTNLAATDQMIDTPQNSTGGNFCTWNSITMPSAPRPLSEGNLKVSRADTAWTTIPGTMGVSSGKWYFEAVPSFTSTENASIGLVSSGVPNPWNGSTDAKAIDGVTFYNNDGGVQVDEDMISPNPYGATYTTGDIIGVAFDMDASPRTVTYYKNNTIVNATVDLTGDVLNAPYLVPYAALWGTINWTLNAGQDSSFAGAKTGQNNTDGNGNGDFYYAPPSGYLAICSDNLPAPSIALPGDHFNTILRDGFGSSGGAVTGVGFEPDFLWQKSLSGSGNHWLTNSVSGDTKYLWSNSNAEEATNANFVVSLDSDGWTMGSDDFGAGTDNIVGWNWKGGGAPTAINIAGAGATPTAGSVKINGSNLGSALAGTTPVLQLSANTTNGFSMGTYTGDGSVATIAHGLSQAPELIIVKCYDGSTFNWTVGWGWSGGGVGGANYSDYMYLNTNDGSSDNATFWDDTLPTASVFTIGTAGSVNTNGDDFLFYAWHSVEGYSHITSYEGNGVVDGPFIYTGFKPAWLMVKSSSGTRDWMLHDNKRNPYNVVTKRLYANLVNAEETYSTPYDFVSNGFKNRSNVASWNGNTEEHLVLAFAESPFKTSNSR